MSVQTVGYLQTASPPVLPPICRLFGRPVRGPHAERPLHAGREPDSSLLEVRTPDALYQGSALTRQRTSLQHHTAEPVVACCW